MTETRLDPAVRASVASAYPGNHNYRLFGRRLVPGWKLFSRHRRILALYPDPLESLVDLSSCKGYFVLHAALRLGCSRVLGIDADAGFVADSIEVRDYVGARSVGLEQLLLHELVARIDEFGGPFQLGLLVNSYHYLFFGSRSVADHYDTHDEIFESLRATCSGSMIFSNCVEVDQLPRHLRALGREQGRLEGYDALHIRTAAERYFEVEEHGRLGRRPLWRLIARPS